MGELLLNDAEWDQLALSNMLDFDRILTEHRIPYWLDYGTLLGVVRDKGLLRKDGDIDVGMFDSSWEDLSSVFGEFSMLGFRTRVRKFKVRGVIFRVVKLSRHGIAVDISLYKRIGERAVDLHNSFSPEFNRMRIARMTWLLYQQLPLPLSLRQRLNQGNGELSKVFRHLDVLPNTLKMDSRSSVRYVSGWHAYFYASIPSSFYSKTEMVVFADRRFPVPSQAEEYLRFLYGPGWTRPDPTYREKNMDWARYFVTKGRIEV